MHCWRICWVPTFRLSPIRDKYKVERIIGWFKYFWEYWYLYAFCFLGKENLVTSVVNCIEKYLFTADKLNKYIYHQMKWISKRNIQRFLCKALYGCMLLWMVRLHFNTDTCCDRSVFPAQFCLIKTYLFDSLAIFSIISKAHFLHRKRVIKYLYIRQWINCYCRNNSSLPLITDGMLYSGFQIFAVLCLSLCWCWYTCRLQVISTFQTKTETKNTSCSSLMANTFEKIIKKLR